MSSEAGGRTGRILALVGLVLVVIVLSLRRLDDWDLPWHLATGRVIAQTHSIPRIDDLAFTHGVVKYTEVISDVLLYGVIHVFGPFGLQLLNGLTVGATALALHRTLRGVGPFSYIVVALAIVTMSPWLYIRPATLSLLLLAVVMLVIDLHRREPESQRSERALLLLVPLQFVWANVHGYAPLGAILLWLHAGHRVVARLRPSPLTPREDGRALMIPIVAAVLSTAATAMSTAGPRLLVMVHRFDEDLEGITEWMRPTLKLVWQISPAAYLLILLVLVALLFGRDPEARTRAPSLFDLMVLVLAGALFLRAIRFIPVAALLVAPFCARRLDAYVRPSRVMHLACGFAAILPAFVVALGIEQLLGIGWQPTAFPEAATQFIEQRRPAGRMWNFMPYGGYLAWRLHPTYRVFNDGRNALARDRSLVTRGRRSMFEAPVFAELVSELDMQWAITCTIPGLCTGAAKFNEPLASSPDWRMVYFDDVAAIYVRRGGPNVALGERGYRAIDHLTTSSSMFELATKGGAKPADLAHDGLLAASQAPTSVRANTFAAIGALATRDQAMFDSAIARLQQIAPDTDAIPTLKNAWQSAPR